MPPMIKELPSNPSNVVDKKGENIGKNNVTGGQPVGATTISSNLAKLSKTVIYQDGKIVVEDLGPDDVLLGRGTGPNEYEGNVRFRSLIRDIILASDVRDSEDCKAKTRLAKKIVAAVKERKGRFLQKTAGSRSRSTKGYTFVVAPDKIALDKTKQSLRHQLRMMDPNFKENREKKQKLRKLREQMLQTYASSSASSSGSSNSSPNQSKQGTFRSTTHVNHVVVHGRNSNQTANPDPLLGVLRQSASNPRNGNAQNDGVKQVLGTLISSLTSAAPAPSASPTDFLAGVLAKALTAAASERPNSTANAMPPSLAAPPAVSFSPPPPPPPSVSDQLREALLKIISEQQQPQQQQHRPAQILPPPPPTNTAPPPSTTIDQSLLLQLLAARQQPPQHHVPQPPPLQPATALNQLFGSLLQQKAQPATPSLEAVLLSALLGQNQGMSAQ